MDQGQEGTPAMAVHRQQMFGYEIMPGMGKSRRLRKPEGDYLASSNLRVSAKPSVFNR